MSLFSNLGLTCGERGIRTPGTFQYNSFQDCRFKPLTHLSKILRGKDTPFCRISKISMYFCVKYEFYSAFIILV